MELIVSVRRQAFVIIKCTAWTCFSPFTFPFVIVVIVIVVVYGIDC